MAKTLFKNLLQTFVFSLLLTGILFAIWYGIKQRESEAVLELPLLFIVGNFFQNILLALATLPVFFLTNAVYFQNHTRRIICYFGGPVALTLLFIVLISHNWFDKLAFLLPGISFIIIHSYYYRRLLSKQSRAK